MITLDLRNVLAGLQGQSKHFQNLISSLNRVNYGDALKLSRSKFQSWLALLDIEFNPYLFEVVM